VPTICHHRTALASLATLATSCGRPREMKATRQSLGSHTPRRGIRFWRSVGKRFLLLVLCFASRVQVAANLKPTPNKFFHFRCKSEKILPCVTR
jgi:hypothetical protein